MSGTQSNASASCGLCGSQHYCSNNDSYSCPLHSTTVTLEAGNQSQCFCIPGYYKNSDATTDTLYCAECEEGFYCPGDGLHWECDTLQTSIVKSTTAEQCTCKAGYYIDTDANCTQCPRMHYCPGNNALLACPYDARSGTVAQSPAGTRSVSGCMCPSGTQLTLYETHSVQRPWKEMCTACGYGFFCAGSNVRQQCPSNSYMDTHSNAYAVSPRACLCNAEHEHNGTDCLPCPVGSSTFGETNATCECRDGFTVLGGLCIVCPQGHYCAKGGLITQCPGN